MKFEIATPVLILALLTVTAVFVAASRKPVARPSEHRIPHPPRSQRAADRINDSDAEVIERVNAYAANR